MDTASNLAIACDHALIMKLAGMPADPWQEELLRKHSPRDMLNCSRQIGKTTVTAASAVIEALYYPPAFVAVLGPSEKQAKEFIRGVGNIMKGLQISNTDLEVDRQLSLELANGSRILGSPANEKTVRGLAGVTYLIFDEASRVPDDLYRAARPMVAVSKGRIALLSTPFGKRGFFFDEWTKGVGWNRVSIRADQCPRMSQSFLEEERRALGPVFFRQEYMCEFAELTNSVFTFEDVQAAMSDDVKPLFAAPESLESDTVKPLFQ